MRVRFRLEAAADVESARAWYDEQRGGLGDEFIEALEHAIELKLPRPGGHFHTEETEVSRCHGRGSGTRWRKPVVRGTRITVESIIERLAAGESVAKILHAHPRLTREGILAAASYGSGGSIADESGTEHT